MILFCAGGVCEAKSAVGTGKQQKAMQDAYTKARNQGEGALQQMRDDIRKLNTNVPGNIEKQNMFNNLEVCVYSFLKLITWIVI